MKREIEKIDFVVTWVDPSDPVWLADFKALKANKTNGDSSVERFRDWELLRFWFRSVEKYAGWVNKIYLVTYGHLPNWIDTNNPKLAVIKHEDFIPYKYLPTFSSHPIELNMHLIPGLEEKFVYFNDDVILNNTTKPSDFFQNGLPCDFIDFEILTSSVYGEMFSHIRLNNNALINSKFSKSNMKKIYSKKYSIMLNIYNILNMIMVRGENINIFSNPHLSQSYLKSSFIKVWKLYADVLDATCNNKFRSIYDVSPYLIRDYQLVNGYFSPINPKNRGTNLKAGTDNSKIEKKLSQKELMLCLNDCHFEENMFENYKNELIGILTRKFPEKSSFEVVKCKI